MTLTEWGIKPALPMSDEQFELWQALVEVRIGITVTPSRRSFLEISLSTRMREIGLDDYETYYERLMSGPASSPEWILLTDRLTVQETSFFRHQSSFKLVEEHLKELIKDNGRHSINIWSAGCSSGEEAYSLAMLTDSLVEERGRKDVFYGVTATDISLPTLIKARQGIFAERRGATVPEGFRLKYMHQMPNHKDWQMNDAIRKRVAFSQLNLMDLERAPFSEMDVIFCQNVLIYFRRFRKRDVVTQLANRLAKGGILVLGLGEIVDWSHPQLERIDYPDTLAFKRVS
ncbi:chemotaxis protein methyltransferase CheR/type IV pilus assembly protein PilK [Fluviicoccus keumensis]|uniref:protein-glutamate O-methyltransferase n=1 Tax=Fluviicoccus keumensis TaxID=1435465 RepID=A0A4Q7ZA75_9GAMM|nr:CheR family methyltransferase [Fluviicoccus keumensis]RZU46994.1 chemotaxis protein methyltransferase CheR/type IV pilus assembly protein PilK [Fluviicoccus keumensis]